MSDHDSVGVTAATVCMIFAACLIWVPAGVLAYKLLRRK